MAYSFPRYDRAVAPCAKGPRPGAIALRDETMRLFPGVTNLGIYNCRTVAGTSSLSTHAAGRAWDAGIPAALKPRGDALAAALVAAAPALGVQEVVWYRRRWTSTTGAWRAYGGVSPHTDHVHVALNADAGERLTPAAVRAALTRVLGGRPPTPPPTPTDRSYRVPETLNLRDAHRTPVRRTSPVRKLQGLLLAHGYRIEVDGVAGKATADLVEQFQHGHGLVPDRVVGPATWRALIEQ